ncbi:tyrosine-type recombinase/integrase [Novosphingobium flavum]|uniref:Tyrosine-type recombinase/integrase n=1 Tax=Novosphingobium flavum TaxID=1778672 RepID=A0A7X1KLK5_9SPHN|nr:tyrosine-type recombinase/integrase [Novosphingobium flavum]MBC2665684.1 tyrosine-type recombinase/integrase [Novosphingobium flavum]
MKVVVSYLQTEKSGILSYRRKFPKELVQLIPSSSPTGRGRIEYKKSLHARSLNEPGAMDRYRAAERDFENIVAAARKAEVAGHKRALGNYDELDAPTIAILAERYRVEALASDDARRRDPEAKALAALGSDVARQVGFELPEVSAAAKWTQSIRLAHSAIRESARTLRATGDEPGIISAWGDLAMSMASDCELELEPGGTSFRDLCSALNNAAATAHEEALRRLDGDDVPTPPMPELPQTKKGSATPSGRISLLDLFNQYAAVPGRHPKTVAQWRPYVIHLAEFVDQADVQSITHDQLVAWRNHLRDEVKFRGQPLSAKTINGSYLGAVNALFAWAKGDNLIPRNPALEVTPVKLPAKPKTRGKAFTTEEALTILRASLVPAQSREGQDLRNAKRWCPWLMAYSGARVNEITQLRKQDVFQDEGVWVMRITPDAGTVKTRTFRNVPLHSHLQEQGFLDFVAAHPDGPLFYNPSKRRSDNAINRQSNRLGSKLAEWVHSLGIDGVKPNHAWRHLFSHLAVRHGLDRVVTKAITGHASSDVHDKTYLEDLPNLVDVLSRELEKMPRFLEVT